MRTTRRVYLQFAILAATCRLCPAATLTTLSYPNDAYGGEPYSGLIMDSSGNLFGTIASSAVTA